MRTIIFFLLLLSPLWASMKVYDSIEEAPRTADLYMMVDGGSFVDVNTVPVSYRKRFTDNPDSYVKVDKDKGKWVVPTVKPQIKEEFKLLPIVITKPDVKPEVKPEVKPAEPINSEDFIVEKNLRISEFRNEVSKPLNEIIKLAKSGRAEAIIEGSLEKVKYFTSIAEASKNGSFSSLNINENDIKNKIADFQKILEKEKNILNEDLEKIKVALVKVDNIPEAESVDQFIKLSPINAMFPNNTNKSIPSVNNNNNNNNNNIPFSMYNMLLKRKGMLEERLKTMPESSNMRQFTLRNLEKINLQLESAKGF